jgi:2',3'-cyclic-nucleotide 2'-phosphodiesterase (5'-nucleotidase family)
MRIALNGSSRGILSTLAAVALIGLAGCDYPQLAGSQSENRIRVVLLHQNDTHFHDNHREAVEAFVNEVRSSGHPLFFLSAGDVLLRHPNTWPEGMDLEGFRARGIELFAWMNALGVDVMTTGNHELVPHGTATRDILESARFPILAANIRMETDLLPKHPPYHILKVPGGPSLAVLGLSVINFEPPEGLEELDYHETVRAYRHLADEHDALVLLTHIGIRYDLELANAFPEVAAIIGGHTNTLLPEAPRVNGVLVAQAGGHDHIHDGEADMFMGVVVLEFEGTRLVDRCGWVVRIGEAGPEAAGQLSDGGDPVAYSRTLVCPGRF